MLVLGLESSCDETAAAIVRDGRVVLADVVSTQAELHQRWGGVVPELASRDHVRKLVPVLDEALRTAGVTLEQLDGIAVTSGPGLIGALLVAVQLGKGLAWALDKPLAAVNHLEGHLLAVRLGEAPPEPPFLGLVVSGGHTSLYAVRGYGRYERLAVTRDDAAGEAFDKVAKLLGLPYPGGVEIDRLAQGGDPKAHRFPRGLDRHDVLDFSFSGLKTSVLYHVKERGRPEGQALADLCASVQEAIADVLVKKALRAARLHALPTIVVCGGVAANSRLRALAAERGAKEGLQVHLPEKRLCTDNGAMIAVAGHHALIAGRVARLDALNADPAWRL